MSNTNTNDPGEAAVPAGYRLGAGWEVMSDELCCLPCPRGADVHEEGGFFRRSDKAGCCRGCAVAFGALVPIKPPVAEPPGFRVVGRSGPKTLPKAGQWVQYIPTRRGPRDAPAQVTQEQAVSPAPVFREWWDEGRYALLEPIHAAPVPPAQPVCKACEDYYGEGEPCDLTRPTLPLNSPHRTPPIPPGPVPPVECQTCKKVVSADTTVRGQCASCWANATIAEYRNQPPPGPVPTERADAQPVCQCRDSAVEGGGICGSPLRTGQIDRCTFCALACDPPPVAEPAQPVCKAVANDGTRCELPEGHPDGRLHVAGEYCWTSGCAECQKDLSGPCARCAGRPLNPPPVPPGPVPPEGEPGGLSAAMVADLSCDDDLPEWRIRVSGWGGKIAALSDQLATTERERDVYKDSADKAMALVKRAETERDEQRGRAETREKHLVDAWHLAQDDAAAMAAQVEQLRAKLEEAKAQADHNMRELGRAEERIADADTRVAESFRTGWADGAEATREADFEAVADTCDPCAWCGTKGDCMACEALAKAEAAIRVLPLPPCPEGPPTPKGDE